MITTAIIIITVIFSVIGFSNPAVFSKYVFNPYTVNTNREWWRFLSHAFLHADWMHLAMNMFVLYSFGGMLERTFVSLFGAKGTLFYMLLYSGAIFLSALPSFNKHKNNFNYNSVGASGAVSAVVFSCILIQPLMKIMFIFIPFPMPAVLFGAAYLVYSWYMAKRGKDNIGHDAHFWGAVFGFAFTIILKPVLFLSFIAQVQTLFSSL